MVGAAGVSHTNRRVRFVNGTAYLFGRSLSEGGTTRVLDLTRDTDDLRWLVNPAVAWGK